MMNNSNIGEAIVSIFEPSAWVEVREDLLGDIGYAQAKTKTVCPFCATTALRLHGFSHDEEPHLSYGNWDCFVCLKYGRFETLESCDFVGMSGLCTPQVMRLYPLPSYIVELT